MSLFGRKKKRNGVGEGGRWWYKEYGVTVIYKPGTPQFRELDTGRNTQYLAFGGFAGIQDQLWLYVIVEVVVDLLVLKQVIPVTIPAAVHGFLCAFGDGAAISWFLNQGWMRLDEISEVFYKENGIFPTTEEKKQFGVEYRNRSNT